MIGDRETLEISITFIKFTDNKQLMRNTYTIVQSKTHHRISCNYNCHEIRIKLLTIFFPFNFNWDGVSVSKRKHVHRRLQLKLYRLSVKLQCRLTVQYGRSSSSLFSMPSDRRGVNCLQRCPVKWRSRPMPRIWL